MKANRMKKLPARLLGLPRTAEWLVRNVLIVGFFVLLALVASLGYLGWQGFQELNEKIEVIRQSEVNHLRIVGKISETTGKIESQAGVVLATLNSKLAAFPQRQVLKQLKEEMDVRIKDGQKTSLSKTPEWARFEAAFEAFWKRINETTPVEWFNEREQMGAALADLESYLVAEREEHDARIQSLSNSEKRKEFAATVAVLSVSLIVAILTFYEIRKTLNKLSLAYAESSESRDYLRSLLDSVDSGIVVIEQDGGVETLSRSFRKMMGLELEADLELNYKKLFQDNETLADKVGQSLENPDQMSRYQGRAEMGNDRLLDVFATPLLIGEERRGLILVFVDVTDAARAQAELRRNRALTAVGQMTAQIAHEIKNPLGSIRFATEVLKRTGAASTSNAETIAVIDRSVDHLATVVAELSDFARPKELKQTELNLNELLDELFPMIADRLSAKRVRVEKDYATDLPTGQYDATELKKLFLNLIINAIDASEPDGIVKVGTRVGGSNQLNGSNQLVVEVADHGVGMDKETLRRLFEPFYTTKEKGTGLGMSIARKITELHKGELVITSKKGVGTTATVRLPII